MSNKQMRSFNFIITSLSLYLYFYENEDKVGRVSDAEIFYALRTLTNFAALRYIDTVFVNIS